jgi:ATP-dependent Clp protease ATP-binding subunit ClpA
MVFLPLITNNLGKIAATAAATTLSAVGYVNRERISRWITGENDDDSSSDSSRTKKKLKEQKRKRRQAEEEAAAATQDLKRLQSQAMVHDLDRKHAELLERITRANETTLDKMREQMTGLRTDLQEQLDTQRAETAQLGKELREAVADLARRQDTMEQFLQGKDQSEVFSVPGRQRAAETPRKQEETVKKPAPNGRRKGNGATGRTMHAA